MCVKQEWELGKKFGEKVEGRIIAKKIFSFGACNYECLWKKYTKLLKPWKMSLILSNLHSMWTKRATFLWKTFIVLCSKWNIFIGPVVTVVWETSRLKNKHAEKTLALHGWTQMVVLFWATLSSWSELHLKQQQHFHNSFPATFMTLRDTITKAGKNKVYFKWIYKVIDFTKILGYNHIGHF